jgi:hypothetical protein
MEMADGAIATRAQEATHLARAMIVVDRQMTNHAGHRAPRLGFPAQGTHSRLRPQQGLILPDRDAEFVPQVERSIRVDHFAGIVEPPLARAFCSFPPTNLSIVSLRFVDALRVPCLVGGDVGTHATLAGTSSVIESLGGLGLAALGTSLHSTPVIGSSSRSRCGGRKRRTNTACLQGPEVSERLAHPAAPAVGDVGSPAVPVPAHRRDRRKQSSGLCPFLHGKDFGFRHVLYEDPSRDTSTGHLERSRGSVTRAVSNLTWATVGRSALAESRTTEPAISRGRDSTHTNAPIGARMRRVGIEWAEYGQYEMFSDREMAPIRPPDRNALLHESLRVPHRDTGRRYRYRSRARKTPVKGEQQ